VLKAEITDTNKETDALLADYQEERYQTGLSLKEFGKKIWTQY